MTPRIDSEQVCRCTRPIVFDPVYGWMHLSMVGAGAAATAGEHVPTPTARP